MPFKAEKALVLATDLLILCFVGIWLLGGVPWEGKTLLKHGADPRRAAILLTLTGALISRLFRQNSRIVLTAQRGFELLQSPRWRWGALLTGFAFASLLGILQTLAMRYPLYDVGIFHQILWSLANGHAFHSTISGAGNFLLDHFSPSLALLTPFYWVTGSSPLILPILHSALVFTGIAGWLYLAERLPETDVVTRNRIAAATVIFALCFDSLWANLRWGFHENSIAFAAMSWALALWFSAGSLRSGRDAIISILFLIAAFSKEILLLNLSMAFLVFGLDRFQKGARRVAIVNWILAPALILLFVAFEKMPHPADKNYFVRYYAYLGRDLGTFLSTLFLAPWKIIEAVGAQELLSYLKTVLLPWLGLPLIWSVTLKAKDRAVNFKALSVLIIAPSFASAALATYPPLRSSGFHYVLELWPVMAALTLLTLPRLRPRWTHAWILVAMLSLGQDPWRQVFEFTKDSREQAEARHFIGNIPISDSISADELAGTWIAGRLQVTRWPDATPFPNGTPDWYLLKKNSAATNRVPPEYLQTWQEGSWVAFQRRSAR